MDNKYQDIHIINVFTKKKIFIMRMVYVLAVNFTDENIIITYTTPTQVKTKIFPKVWNKLIID